MPAYAIRVALSQGVRRSATWVSVDASYGGFALFERLDALREQDPEGEAFPPLLDVEAAARLARQGLLKYILRRRGRKSHIESVEEVLLYYAPVWVFYVRRLRGRIDLAVRDGYTGDPMGGAMRQAVLNAIIRKHKASRGA